MGDEVRVSAAVNASGLEMSLMQGNMPLADAPSSRGR